MNSWTYPPTWHKRVPGMDQWTSRVCTPDHFRISCHTEREQCRLLLFHVFYLMYCNQIICLWWVGLCFLIFATSLLNTSWEQHVYRRKHTHTYGLYSNRHRPKARSWAPFLVIYPIRYHKYPISHSQLTHAESYFFSYRHHIDHMILCT